MWHNEPQEIKDYWHSLAREEKAEHQRKYPNYKFSPRKSSEKKRRSTTKKSTAQTLQLVNANQTTNQAAQGLIATASSDNPVVTITGSTIDVYAPYIAPAPGPGDLNLLEEAKIFLANMAAEAEEMRNEVSEMMVGDAPDNFVEDFFNNLQGGDDAQVDDGPFQQLEELEFDDAFLAEFFKNN